MAGYNYELGLLREFVSINTDVTTKKGYTECADLVAEKMKALGLKVETFDPFSKVGDGLHRPNVIGTLDVGAERTIGLASHYDVVPPGEGWTRDPFKLTVEGDRAYGRGASDDKSSIAASLGAVKMVGENAKYNVKLIVSPEEEIGGEWGIGYVMNEVNPKLDWGVVVDAMPNTVCIGASGIVWGEIRVHGRQGHAGYPHTADNPIPKLAKLILDFDGFIRQRELKLSVLDAPPGSPKEKVWGRLSFTIMGAGEKENIIPSTAWVKFDMRVLPEELPKTASAEMLAYFNKLKEDTSVNADINFYLLEPGFVTPASEPFVKEFADATAAVFGSPLPLVASLGGDDGKFFAEKHIPVVSYGAIAEDTNFHGSDEFLRLKDLQDLRDVLAKLIG